MRELTLEEKCAYLRGFADADGYMSRANLTTNRIELTNTDKKLMDLISSYLTELGIEHGYLLRTQGKGNRVPCWRIQIGKYRNLKIWHELIGFSISYKWDRLVEAIAKYESGKTRIWGGERKPNNLLQRGTKI